YTYDLKPGVTPEGEEFVSYFLDVQKKGYCTYYASAGVMLMRRLGVPARYVEGYIIEPSQYSADKSYITVSDRCAHAWCEVFIDGCGWYPLEFTPGYESDNPNLTDYDKNVKTEPQYKQTVSRPEKKDNSSSRSSKSSSSRSDSSRSSSSSKAGAASSAQSSGGSKTGGSKSGSGTGSGDGGRKPDNVEDTKIDLMQLAYIMLTLGFIAVVLLTTAVRRKNNLARLHRQNNSPDNRKSVISCYTTFLEYAKLLGIDRGGNLTDVQLTVKVSEMLKEKMPEMCGSFIELSDTALLAYMSDQEISDEESTLSRKTLSELRRRTYELLNLPQKLFAKWVLGLY
ncbi:MAG: transglutaminase domain-containing protein, partial [Ruminococcus sp.]|nr:transglutaminase domain-containing protein [Ruminococcus sp.]